jgi:hypothetical protein
LSSLDELTMDVDNQNPDSEFPFWKPDSPFFAIGNLEQELVKQVLIFIFFFYFILILFYFVLFFNANCYLFFLFYMVALALVYILYIVDSFWATIVD